MPSLRDQVIEKEMVSLYRYSCLPTEANSPRPSMSLMTEKNGIIRASCYDEDIHTALGTTTKYKGRIRTWPGLT